MTKPVVAIIGRPNVGKSTFFNRVVGQRKAIVHDEPGVTRDRHYGEAEWAGREFILIDTGGYVPDSGDVFEKAIREQVAASVEEAAVIVFLVDGQDGLFPMDRDIAALLRRSAKPVVLVVNKIDGARHETAAAEFHALGLGTPHPVSALGGRLSGDVLDVVVAGFAPATDEGPAEIVRLAIIGRPNVGKSSMTNAILGRPRSIVTDVPGTTRDAVDATLTAHGHSIVLIDTAGLRRRSRVRENLEYFSTLRTLKAIQRCDVALCLIDGVDGLTHQDADILAEVVSSHKGVVIGVNKWDLVDKDAGTAQRVEKEIHARLRTFDFIPVVFVSAVTHRRVDRALALCIEVYEERRRRVGTAELNERLGEILRDKPPPSTPTGREVKILYTTQVRTEPPVVVIFTNEPKYIPESYRRFVERNIRELYGFTGVPLTVQFRRTSERRARVRDEA